MVRRPRASLAVDKWMPAAWMLAHLPIRVSLSCYSTLPTGYSSVTWNSAMIWQNQEIPDAASMANDCYEPDPAGMQPGIADHSSSPNGIKY
jgi:hypothetical protein